MTQDTYKGSAWAPWTQHLYGYVGNNPVNLVDPTGHAARTTTMDSGEGGYVEMTSTQALEAEATGVSLNNVVITEVAAAEAAVIVAKSTADYKARQEAAHQQRIGQAGMNKLARLEPDAVPTDGDWKNKAPSSITQWASLIEAAAKKYNLSPALIAAVMMHESGGINYLTPNKTGDAGVMQLNLRAQGVTLAQATDPVFAIDHAAGYLAGLFKMFDGDPKKAVQAYNYGEGNVGNLVDDYGASWMDHRSEIRNGDPKYYEHVTQYLTQWS